MSAFLVSKRHIDTMVEAAILVGLHRSLIYRGVLPPGREAASELGRLLWRENLRSLEARYRGGAPDDDFVTAYKWTPTHLGSCGEIPKARIPALLKAIECYEYQSCEHGGWEESHARRMCEALRRALISRLPGYSEAPWCIEDDGEGVTP